MSGMFAKYGWWLRHCRYPFLSSHPPYVPCTYTYVAGKTHLKGQYHEIFCFWFFHESVSPQPKSFPLGPFQIFSKMRGDICKSRCTTGTNDTNRKFCYQFRKSCWYRWQSCHLYQRYRWQICHRCQRHRWQIATGQRHRRQIYHWCKRHQWKTMGTIIRLLTT